MTGRAPKSASTHQPNLNGNKTSSRFALWFANRAPRQDEVSLNLRNVYIFFSREGALFALLLLITFIAGINYANNLVLGLCFYLISIWVISFHLTFAQVMGLTVQLLEVTVAEAGSPAWVTLKVSSKSNQPRRQLGFCFEQSDLSFEQSRKVSSAQQPVNGSGSKVWLPSMTGEQIIMLPVVTQKRGRLVLPRLIVSSVYPLGIMRAWSYVYFATPAWVIPKPIKFDWQAQYIAASEEVATQSPLGIEGQQDFERLDDYVEGQSLARVSWAHVARGQGMLTKNFVDPAGRELRLDYRDMPGIQHEQKLSQLAFAIHKMAVIDVPFQLVLPDEGIGADGISKMGQGQAFIQASLLRLAKVR